nr:hypothetical protein [uncultured Clostridium sp.]
MRKKGLSLLIASLLITSSLTTTVFANSTDSIIDSNIKTESSEIITKQYLTNDELLEMVESGELDEDSLITPYGVGTPACYEYSTKRAYLTVSNIDSLKSYADLVYNSNSTTDKIQKAVNYAAYLTSTHYPAVSGLLSTANITSWNRVCPYDVTSWCYDTVRYMTSKGYSKVDTNVKFNRFWNGHAYSKPWQPCEAPSTLGYVH